MTTTDHAQTSFADNDYLNLPVPPDMEGLYTDVHRGFGWQVDQVDRPRLGGAVVLRMHRPRAVATSETGQLYRAVRTSLDRVERLRRSISSVPSAIAIGLGLIGAALLAGAVFAMLASVPFVMVVLGAVGLALWAVNWPLFRGLRTQRSRRLAARIDRELRQVSSSTAQAVRLVG